MNWGNNKSINSCDGLYRAGTPLDPLELEEKTGLVLVSFDGYHRRYKDTLAMIL